MRREEIIDRILYSHYLEKLFSTVNRRIDKLISALLLIFGSAIVLQGNQYFFGVLIVVLSALQSTYQFGTKAGEAKKNAYNYLKLYTNESKFDDSELKCQLLELERKDEIIWSFVEPIALLKTQIRLNVKPEFQEKLSWYQKLILLCCS